MVEKKRQILDAARKCFTERGYRGTSIQDIADALGMAKGSLYFYFKSKEDLLVSICKLYIDRMFKELRAILEDPSVSPRDKLVRQVVLHYSHFMQYGNFLKMLMEERFEGNDELHQTMFAVRAYSLGENQKCIVELYGEEARPYAFDAATLFSATVTGYLGYMMKEQLKLDFEKLAVFLVDRLEEMVLGMIERRAEPVMQAEQIRQFHQQNPSCGGYTMKPGVIEEIRAIRDLADSLELKPGLREEISSTLQVLEAEFEKPEPQVVLVKGMLALLKSLKQAKLKKPIANIEAYL